MWADTWSTHAIHEHSNRGEVTMNTDSPTATVLSGLDKVRAWQEDLYRTLHQYPELSYEEHHTAATVAERLRSFGYDVHDNIGGTGVVGILHNGEGPTVLMRS